jgi:hypothetical protein
VCAEPFQQAELNSRLLGMLETLPTSGWSENGLEYGKRSELYTLPQVALEIIERLAAVAGKSRG